jgi:hypothetical protein
MQTPKIKIQCLVSLHPAGTFTSKNGPVAVWDEELAIWKVAHLKPKRKVTNILMLDIHAMKTLREMEIYLASTLKSRWFL